VLRTIRYVVNVALRELREAVVDRRLSIGFERVLFYIRNYPTFWPGSGGPQSFITTRFPNARFRRARSVGPWSD
jgi:hypothetical protein